MPAEVGTLRHSKPGIHCGSVCASFCETVGTETWLGICISGAIGCTTCVDGAHKRRSAKRAEGRKAPASIHGARTAATSSWQACSTCALSCRSLSANTQESP